jgi:DNA uptake protein ComE-like DNA-binding protein
VGGNIGFGFKHVRAWGARHTGSPSARSREDDEEEPMALPKLSDADRKAALKKAAEARQKRAALRADIKSGKITFAAVMKKTDDPIVARLKVAALLESLPGFGKAKAAKIMGELEISDSRRVQGLGARQREMLMERLG